MSASNGIELGIDHLDQVEVIGRGGFSVVYAATDTRFHRRVAVKVLGPLVDDSDRRRFDRECQVMGRLSSHPNVVTVYDAGFTAEQRPYLIMELVEGGSLAKHLELVGRVVWDRAVDYILPVCDALDRAHREGILHRDIKPENVLLDSDRPLLTDFGIAQVRGGTGTASTNVSASLMHAPPETFDNARDERSDLYSLTSTLYTLIAGRPPFTRSQDDSLSPLILRILHERPPDLPSHLGPASLNDFVRRGLAKNPAGRPQTATELGRWLQRIRDEPGAEPVEATRSAPSYERKPVEPVEPFQAHQAPRSPYEQYEPAATPLAAQPAGWYYAHGDPRGTQRYWDGIQWIGGPHHVQPGRQHDLVAGARRPGAGYGPRAAAFIVDGALLVAVLVLLSVVSVIADAVSSGAGDAVTSTAYLPLLAFALWNSCLEQGRSGQTIGKRVLHLCLVQDRTGRPAGIAMASLRLLLGWVLAFMTCFVIFPVLNWLWPLWDRDGKRLSDRILGLSVVEVASP